MDKSKTIDDKIEASLKTRIYNTFSRISSKIYNYICGSHTNSEFVGFPIEGPCGEIYVTHVSRSYMQNRSNIRQK
jgi:hypothetical protein